MKVEGTTKNGKTIIGNGFYGDAKRAWVVDVSNTSYGREINKTEVRPNSILASQDGITINVEVEK